MQECNPRKLGRHMSPCYSNKNSHSDGHLYLSAINALGGAGGYTGQLLVGSGGGGGGYTYNSNSSNTSSFSSPSALLSSSSSSMTSLSSSNGDLPSGLDFSSSSCMYGPIQCLTPIYYHNSALAGSQSKQLKQLDIKTLTNYNYSFWQSSAEETFTAPLEIAAIPDGILTPDPSPASSPDLTLQKTETSVTKVREVNVSINEAANNADPTASTVLTTTLITTIPTTKKIDEGATTENGTLETVLSPTSSSSASRSSILSLPTAQLKKKRKMSTNNDNLTNSNSHQSPLTDDIHSQQYVQQQQQQPPMKSQKLCNLHNENNCGLSNRNTSCSTNSNSNGVLRSIPDGVCNSSSNSSSSSNTSYTNSKCEVNNNKTNTNNGGSDYVQALCNEINLFSSFGQQQHFQPRRAVELPVIDPKLVETFFDEIATKRKHLSKMRLPSLRRHLPDLSVQELENILTTSLSKMASVSSTSDTQLPETPLNIQTSSIAAVDDDAVAAANAVKANSPVIKNEISNEFMLCQRFSCKNNNSGFRTKTASFSSPSLSSSSSSLSSTSSSSPSTTMLLPSLLAPEDIVKSEHAIPCQHQISSDSKNAFGDRNNNNNNSNNNNNK
ncbi:putative uncharacterized protein DDB_G0277255 [Octopus sinensis]|uniref:Uncharacterized protein n=1 Tax=Octopus sinensis TaxID=2607531 RepID=A0A7E6EHT6_9MOLL|nr:putative uncharacterized protein DDB_G0277255 [Octopus sinensis]